MAGITSPLAFFIAFFLVLTLGISLTQLARHLPSAGGYFTYVSRTVHPRAGFLTAWLYFLYDPTSTALNLAFMGFFFESTMRGSYGLALSMVGILFGGYGGSDTTGLPRDCVSTEMMIFLSVAEILIVIALPSRAWFTPALGESTWLRTTQARLRAATDCFSEWFFLFSRSPALTLSPRSPKKATIRSARCPRAHGIDSFHGRIFLVLCLGGLDRLGYG